jgi:HSP20 family protein
MLIEGASEANFGQAVRQMSKMMEQIQKGFCSFSANEVWTPAVNLYEMEGIYLVCVDLAGVDKEKIDLSIVEGRLKLRGERPTPVPPPPGSPPTRVRMHLLEIDHGQFYREVDLPDDVAHDRIKASYNNGMLWIELPKK